MTSAEPPQRQSDRSSRWITLVLCVAGTVVSLQQTFVVPLIPEWPRLLHTDEASASWLVTATLLSSAVSTPVMARFADMYGKRRIMIVSLAVMTVGSLLALLSTQIGLLIFARTLQGLGGCLIPIGISIMRDELPRERVGSAIALMSATLGIGAAVGLPLAGALAQLFSWHALFIVSGVLGLLTLGGVLVVVPESNVSSSDRFDVLGATGLALGMLALLVPITQGGRWGWASPGVWGLFFASVVVLGLWVVWELRLSAPVVDLRTTLHRPVLLTNLASILIGFAMYTNMMTTTQFLQVPEASGYGLGSTLLVAGFAMLPGGLLMVGFSPVAARIIARIGARHTLMLGALALAAAYLNRVWMTGSLWHVILGASLCSATTAIAYASIPSIITSSVPITETASANGINALMRSIGTSTCAAVSGAVLTSMPLHLPGHTVPTLGAFRLTFALAAAAACAGCVMAYFIPRGSDVAVHAPGPGTQDRVVSGRVTLPDGAAAPRGTVSALTMEGDHVDWGRVEDGRYRLALPASGRYVFVATSEARKSTSQVIDVDLACGLPPLRLGADVHLSGHVLAGERAVAGARVVLSKHSGQFRRTTTSDDSGYFQLPLPPPDRYFIVAYEQSGRSASHIIFVSSRPLDVSFDLAD